MTLGTLEPVDLRMEWPHEEDDFTPPWLEDNIHFLAKALDLEDDLEVESREERIGRYKADLICSSQAGTVIVENQLDEADHRHLGQVLAGSRLRGRHRREHRRLDRQGLHGRTPCRDRLVEQGHEGD